MTVEPDVKLDEVEIDPIQRSIGVPYGGVQLKDPFVTADFRRWATHTDNYNPLHYDDRWAAESRFGEIVAPQSYTALQAIGEETYAMSPQPMIPYHSADEYFFAGPRVHAGDHFQINRMPTSYKLANTRYGPSVFLDVDIDFSSQRGAVVKKRATTMMHPAVNQRILGDSMTEGMNFDEPVWSDEQLATIDKEKLDYVKSWRTHDKRLFRSVSVGTKLERCVIGPHSGTSFLYAQAGDPEDVWGALHVPTDQPPLLKPGSTINPLALSVQLVDPVERVALMPKARGHNMMKDGRGGHIYAAASRGRGMPRAFQIGTTLSVWSVDYLANWAGEWGFLRHSTIRFDFPVLSGDLTYIDGVVTGTTEGSTHGTVHVEFTFSDQNGVVSCRGTGDIELPLA